MSIGWKFIFLGLILSIAGVSAEEGTTVLGKCKVCASTDEKCTTEPESFQDIGCSKDETECFTLIDNQGKISRGCVNGTNKCDDTNCIKCPNKDNAGCNKEKDIFACKNCDTTTDENCSIWQDPNSVKFEICSEGVKKCIKQIKTDKNIERRCASTTDTCTDNKICEICDTSGCNKDIFPTGRRQCYQCEGSNCNDPLTDTIIPSLPCRLYDENDKCFVYGTETSMTRGCASNATAYAKCKEEKEKCLQCDTDNCNVVKYKVTQPIKCIQCSADNTDCAWGFATTDAKDCTNPILYYQSAGCYTYIVSDGKVERGCINDIPTDCTAGSKTCTTCNEAACNKNEVSDHSCYKCRSDENPSCALKLEGEKYKSENCRNPVTQALQGCYTERWKNIVIRSCLVDADEKTRKDCMNDNYKYCVTCTENNCNKEDAPNSSPQVIAHRGCLLALVMLFVKFL